MISSVNSADQSGKLALDTKSLGNLKASAAAGSPEALRGAATQFEAMFINMMMKSMREATPTDGMTDNEQTKTFTTMLDSQLSQTMAKRGMGLADMLVRQMSSQTANAQALAIGGGAAGTAASSMNAAPDQLGVAFAAKAAIVNPTSTGNAGQAPHVRAFQEKLAAHADEAAAATGIPAKFMLGQAALESGWGKREIKNADGTSSHNLFGIKAGASWTGKTTTAVTTEYVNGTPVTRREKFRAYDSYADSFKDYAKVIANNPRYEKVMASGGDAATFAQGLQKAGYATDPHYATKLTRIIKNSLA
ncbi:flagellar assembly peptidoglycan hydrolase FlgJ [Massilia sp. S19_KUP03_FR1]|uniref:flagellar assembly peptidoglycan hydrolase FlgJ n=1 Tax=Massilia sp. S19_KUP03_FR1 TaxID=3025503 RepID=UPI002FCDAC95